jgi:hypothetical protein
VLCISTGFYHQGTKAQRGNAINGNQGAQGFAMNGTDELQFFTTKALRHKEGNAMNGNQGAQKVLPRMAPIGTNGFY